MSVDDRMNARRDALLAAAFGFKLREVKSPIATGDYPMQMLLDCGNGVSIGLVLIPAGTFTMGSNDGEVDEKPPHKVTISKAFYLGKYAVTQAQWQAVMRGNPSDFKGDRNLPVENVSWDDCQEFCGKLSAKTEQAIRLPTEAEWEFACRARIGDDISKLDQYAWFYENSDGKTHPVGQKRANAWCLYDMIGNVWEWCADWYGPYVSGAQTDPRGMSSGNGRVLRGGSWYSLALDCRAAYRDSNAPGYRNDNYGFRCAVGT